MQKTIAVTACVVAAAFAQTVPASRQISSLVRANDLKADVSFLASDVLEGRGTPSRALDIAAEYVAAQFRRAGLEPAGDEDYFQNAAFTLTAPNQKGMELTLTIGGRRFEFHEATAMLIRPGAAGIQDETVVRAAAIDRSSVEQYKGKVLLVEDVRLISSAAQTQAALVILASDVNLPPPEPALREASAPPPAAPPVVLVRDPGVRTALAEGKDASVTVSARIPPPAVEPVTLRNVAGLLRGSDPKLKETCVVVSAHYDHVGTRPNAEGDRIFNGANDNASGTAGVIAIARALGSLRVKPKRSILFLALAGEEAGTLGSRYYVRHPLFPIEKTVADINLEQIGRTDGGRGANLLQFNLTGFDYSDIASILLKAGAETGVRAIKDGANSDRYFSASDNIAFAQAGVPSTTVSVTYQFPDYHRPGDEWPKLDYENMAKVSGALAAGVFRMADGLQAPRWNDANPRTEPYRKAREKTAK